mmetsp:Transcript_27800/g.69877  ORF Transcript_27800/g.69877 Transcript_27800/m.69877 type:complete len:203 (-) Transcript_27800:53-661(-)
MTLLEDIPLDAIRAFMYLDKDGDGVISHDDLQKCIPQASKHVPFPSTDENFLLKMLQGTEPQPGLYLHDFLTLLASDDAFGNPALVIPKNRSLNHEGAYDEGLVTTESTQEREMRHSRYVEMLSGEASMSMMVFLANAVGGEAKIDLEAFRDLLTAGDDENGASLGEPLSNEEVDALVVDLIGDDPATSIDLPTLLKKLNLE